MRYSLILATLNRPKELKECLMSLEKQKYKNFEVIIIDQSKTDDTEKAVYAFATLDIKYFRVDFTGLSIARNYGLKYAQGEYFCLLDDDAVYREDYLSNAESYLEDSQKQILSGRILSNEDFRTPFVKYEGMEDREKLDVTSVLNYCPSAALVIPANVITECGYFDERLGVGNEFASGEETDYILRAFDSGYVVKHCKQLVAYHPIKPVNYSNLKGVYQHAMGKGALYYIDTHVRRNQRLLIFALKNTFGMMVKMLTGNKNKRKYYRARLLGFVKGYRTFPR